MSDVQIFQLFSLAYLAMGIGMLINTDYYKRLYLDFIESPATLLFSGIAALVIGYLIVTFHNVWVKDWPVIITILGWISFIKGMLLLVRPKGIVAMTKAMASSTKFLRIEAVIIIIIALLFSFLGFCPKSPLV